MAEGFPGSERREFFRYRYERPIHYKKVAGPAKGAGAEAHALHDAVAKNVSASGILFSGDTVPELSSIIVLDLDYRTTQICQEIEERALIVGEKLLGKVVRIEDNNDGRYDIGVAFITKNDNLIDVIRSLIQ